MEEVYQEYPERINRLLQSINLNYDGLSQVKEAFDKGNVVTACKHLLNYYREGETAQFLRPNLPSTSKNINSGADSILVNIFTFYNLSAKVPHDSNGGDHQTLTLNGANSAYAPKLLL